MAYSRLASVEEKKNLRNAVIFILLTIVTVVALFIVGIPTLGKFVGFVSDVGKSNKPIVINDKTPPAPPRFNTFQDFTNQSMASISGTTEPGATVKLTFNGSEQDTVADKDGNFSFNGLSLNLGDNTFTAVAIDTAGNSSQPTKQYKITFNNKPPQLNIASPGDGTQFFGSAQRQVTIQGTTDVNTQVTINDRIVAVDDTGKFQYTTTLSDGQNKFAIKATDAAGNSVEKDLTLNFSS